MIVLAPLATMTCCHSCAFVRALAIALFYTCGTFVGGVFGPALFGYLVSTGSRELLFRGYLAGASVP